MGCGGGCGGRAASVGTFPREEVMPDGSRVEVTSLADLRTKREQVFSAMRRAAAGRGYTARRA